jgi:type I restriction enzyme S subunit
MNSHIGDFVTFAKGKPPKETFEQPQPGLLPYLSPEYLRGVAQPLWVPSTSSSVHVDDGEPIILWDGSNAGEIFSAKRGVLASTMAVARPKDSELDFRYLGFALQLHEERLRGFTAGSGIPHVEKSIVKRLPFRKPDLLEQRAITSALESVTEHAEATKSSLVAAEDLSRGLLSDLVSGRIRPDGSVRSAGEFLAHRKLGLVPVGWNVEPLKNLADIQRGRFSHRPRNEPRFYGGPHPFIQTGEVSSSRGYIRSHNQTLTDAGVAISRLFPKGTVFISIVGANVAKAAIASYDVYAPDSVIGMIPTGVIVPELLELWLRMNQTRIALLAGDSAKENLNYTILKPMLVAFPKDEAEQQEIADRLYDLENLMDAKRAKITALQRLKKSLMQNLLTGRMRLSPEAIAELTAEAGKSGGA